MSFSPLLCGDCVATEQRRKNIRGGPAALRTSLPEATLDGLQPAAPPGERKRPRRACGPPHLPAGNCLCRPAALRTSLPEATLDGLQPAAPPGERKRPRRACDPPHLPAGNCLCRPAALRTSPRKTARDGSPPHLLTQSHFRPAALRTSPRQTTREGDPPHLPAGTASAGLRPAAPPCGKLPLLAYGPPHLPAKGCSRGQPATSPNAKLLTKVAGSPHLLAESRHRASGPPVLPDGKRPMWAALRTARRKATLDGLRPLYLSVCRALGTSVEVVA